jgi:hypothetical protein
MSSDTVVISKIRLRIFKGFTDEVVIDKVVIRIKRRM